MLLKEFMELWCDKNIERTVVITEHNEGKLTLVVSFPPDTIAIGKIDLCIHPDLDDPF